MGIKNMLSNIKKKISLKTFVIMSIIIIFDILLYTGWKGTLQYYAEILREEFYINVSNNIQVSYKFYIDMLVMDVILIILMNLFVKEVRKLIYLESERNKLNKYI